MNEKPRSVEITEMITRLYQNAQALDKGVAMSNWVLSDICEALALLLEKK